MDSSSSNGPYLAGNIDGSPTPVRIHAAKASISTSTSFAANRANATCKQGFAGVAGFNPPFTLDIRNAAMSAQPVSSSPSSYILSAHGFKDSDAYWLILYFFFNLSLTLYNKIALTSFPFPWTLTCLHSLAATIGSWAAYKRGYFQRSAALQLREQLVLMVFSTLYTVNIAISNLSLNLVSVPFHQVVRSTTPLFTMIICICMFKKTYLLQTYLSLIPVIAGVCLAT